MNSVTAPEINVEAETERKQMEFEYKTLKQMRDEVGKWEGKKYTGFEFIRKISKTVGTI